MASNAGVVIFITSWIVVGLGYGALQLHVTVNPVEIWAAPGSRSRIEKDFFDKNFAPFYRTEQVFIKAVNLPDVSTCTLILFLVVGCKSQINV